MLFLQGTRDQFAQLDLLTGVCEKLGPRATLQLIDDADHSFKVPKRSGTPEQVMAGLADRLVEWGTPLTAAREPPPGRVGSPARFSGCFPAPKP